MGNKEAVNRLDDESRSKVVARLQARRTDILVSEPSRLPDVPKCGHSPGRAPLRGGDELAECPSDESSGQLKDVNTAVVAGVRLYMRF